MSATVLEQLLKAEENQKLAEKQFLEAKAFEKKLRQRREDGRFLYEGWRGTSDWQKWRLSQLERQNWQCACCGKLMQFSEKTKLPTGNVVLHPDHPTVEHVLPKSYFSELALDKQNLVMACWACNKRKSNNMVKASRFRHQQLMQKLKRKEFPDH